MWFAHGETDFKISEKLPRNKEVSFSVKGSDLDALVPGLSTSLRKFIDFKEKNRGRTYIYANEAKDTYLMMLGGGETFVDRGGSPCFLNKLKKMEVSSNVYDPVELVGTVYIVERYEIDGVSVPYLTSVTDRTIMIDRQELDKRYPGWSQRYTLGKEIGVDVATLKNHLFSNEYLPKISVDELTFNDDNTDLGNI